MLHDERKTVRSSLIYPLTTAISPKSCYIRSLCNVFLSDLAAGFSIILFSRKESTHCSSWTKETIQSCSFLQHTHCKEQKVTMGDETLQRAQ